MFQSDPFKANLLVAPTCSLLTLKSGLRVQEQTKSKPATPQNAPNMAVRCLAPTDLLYRPAPTGPHCLLGHTGPPSPGLLAWVACSLLSPVESYFMVWISVPPPGTAQVSSCILSHGRTKAEAWFITWPFVKPIKMVRKLTERVNTYL